MEIRCVVFGLRCGEASFEWQWQQLQASYEHVPRHVLLEMD